MANTHKILLYYQYVTISDPAAVCAAQKELCQSLNLKGRILVADEGINGTIAGTPENIDEYIVLTSQDPRFAKIEWKVSWADEQVFPKLRVVVRDEIVTLGIKKSGSDVSLKNKANYIEPEELQALYDTNEDFIILDARNSYEAEIGKFKNSIVPPIDNFRDFPAFAKKIAKYKNKDVVTYCTGGVRCEKASAYLREQGFKKVRQLHGGVHVYAEKTGGKHFEGELFVFDKRLHVPINTVNPSVVARCLHCNQKISRYIDCAVKSCYSLFICCRSCEQSHQACCSKECQQKIVIPGNQKRISTITQAI